MQKHYVDLNGKYIGGFDGVTPIVESVEVPAPPLDAKHIWNGTVFEPPAVTSHDISTERERRIALGQNASVTGIGSFLVDTRNDEDFRNINGLVSKGIVLQLSGDTTTTVTFRDADNIDRVMTGAQLIEMGASVGNEVDKIYKKSWALKAMDPIPQDYTDDLYWT